MHCARCHAHTLAMPSCKRNNHSFCNSSAASGLSNGIDGPWHVGAWRARVAPRRVKLPKLILSLCASCKDHSHPCARLHEVARPVKCSDFLQLHLAQNIGERDRVPLSHRKHSDHAAQSGPWTRCCDVMGLWAFP
jgi:hypothetical protein